MCKIDAVETLASFLILYIGYAKSVFQTLTLRSIFHAENVLFTCTKLYYYLSYK